MEQRLSVDARMEAALLKSRHLVLCSEAFALARLYLPRSGK